MVTDVSAHITTRDIFSMYHRLMAEQIRIVEFYRDRDVFLIELSRSLSERERARVDDFQLDTIVSRRIVVRGEIAGSELEAPEVQVAAVHFFPFGVLQFEVPANLGQEYADRRMLAVEELVKTLNSELSLEREKKAAIEQAAEGQRERERGLKQTLANARRRREP